MAQKAGRKNVLPTLWAAMASPALLNTLEPIKQALKIVDGSSRDSRVDVSEIWHLRHAEIAG